MNNKFFRCGCCGNTDEVRYGVEMRHPQKNHFFMCNDCYDNLIGFNAKAIKDAEKTSTVKSTSNYYQARVIVNTIDDAMYLGALGFTYYKRLNYYICESAVEEGFRKFSNFDTKMSSRIKSYSVHCVARIGNRDGQNDIVLHSIADVRKWRDRCIR